MLSSVTTEWTPADAVPPNKGSREPPEGPPKAPYGSQPRRDPHARYSTDPPARRLYLLAQLSSSARRLSTRSWRESGTSAATDLRRLAESATPSPGQMVPAVKPEVSDPKLNNIVDNLHKGVSNPQRVGDGTTADAVRHERQTGEATHGRSHEQKAQDSLRGLENWLHRNPEAPASDRLTAQREAANLRNALGEE